MTWQKRETMEEKANDFGVLCGNNQLTRETQASSSFLETKSKYDDGSDVE